MWSYKTIFIFLWGLAAQNLLVASSDDMKELLEAQFLNLTEDIKVGAVELMINVEDIDIAKVRSRDSSYHLISAKINFR